MTASGIQRYWPRADSVTRTAAAVADAAAALTACVHPGSGRASAVDSLARASHWQARASPSQAEAPSRTAGPGPLTASHESRVAVAAAIT